LTFDEAIGEIAKATGRDITYLPVTPQEYAAGMVEAGEPAEFATFLSDLLGMVLDGRNAYLTDGVERALGRPACDFRD
jgi:hypothetical protein